MLELHPLLNFLLLSLLLLVHLFELLFIHEFGKLLLFLKVPLQNVLSLLVHQFLTQVHSDANEFILSRE